MVSATDPLSRKVAWDQAMRARPLVAILRGLKPEEAPGIGEALIEGGFLCLEVPLNSPDPFVSIATLQAQFGNRALVGAGTVLNVDQVNRLSATGATLCISPNVDAAVIRAAKAAGLISIPAFYTPTEAFAAVQAGADALKLFPAETGGSGHLKAMKAVLPPEVPVLAVGGVGPDSIQSWRNAGATGFGMGSAIFKPGDTSDQVYDKAKAFVAAWTASTA